MVPITPTVPPAIAAAISLTVGPITTPLKVSSNAYPVPTVDGSMTILGAAWTENVPRRRLQELLTDSGGGRRFKGVDEMKNWQCILNKSQEDRALLALNE